MKMLSFMSAVILADALCAIGKIAVEVVLYEVIGIKR
jgi:hypothetical protein